MPRPAVRRLFICIALFVSIAFGGLSTVAGKGRTPPPPPVGTPTPIQVFGVWHCGNHYCDWNETINITEFGETNRWLLHRDPADPSSLPAVNLVVLSFVNPLQLLAGEIPTDMVPRGMTLEVVNYFKSADIRVMMSIGGITYTDDWDAALAANPTKLGLNAAAVARYFGVGIEIDYENSSSPNLVALQAFIDAYRDQHPYDASGSRPEARLTIDVAAGDRWLIALNRHATQYWLNPEAPVLDYANAMVSG
ncbi:MAG: hypothetical protein ACM3O5_09525, partial [Betaproteobacteria bacterium]